MYLRGKSSTKGSLLSRRGRGARPSPSTRRNRATNPRDTSLLSSRLQFELAGLSARPIHSLDPFHFLRKQSFRFLTESPLITLIRYPFRDELWRTEEQFDLPYFFRKKEEEEETENEKEKGKEKETIIDVCYIKARTTRGRAAIRLTTLPQSIHVFVNN